MRIEKRKPDPFFYPRGETGVLLLHGFTGSTADLQPMGKFYEKLGYTVYAPLLAGHGTTPQEMEKTRWWDWWQSALQGYDHLVRFGCKTIAVAGLSMGGLLALRLGLFRPAVALIPMNPAILLRDKKIRWAKYIHYFYGKAPRKGQKEDHIEKEIYPYDYTPVVCAASLYEFVKIVRKELPEITTPVFIQQAEKDETIFPRGASYIYKKIGSNYRLIKYYPHSGHIITLDRERERLFKEGESFLQKVIGEGL